MLFVYILIAITACMAAAFAATAFLADAPVTPRARLQSLGSTPTFGAPLKTRTADLPFSERVIKPLVQSLAAMTEKLGLAGDTRLVHEKLEMSGHPKLLGVQLGVREYLALKLVFAVIAVLLFLLLFRHPLFEGLLGIASTAFIAVVVYMLPTLYVDHMVDARKHAVNLKMSDTLDLLVVSAEAGLSLDAAMGRVAQKQAGPLADEFEIALQEMRLGKSRAEALRGVARRTGVMEVKMFTNSIIQAESLGVSIAQVLRTQADTHRERRAQRIREAAAKLPVKMMFPLIFFILPAIFIVVAGPGFIAIMRALSTTSR